MRNYTLVLSSALLALITSSAFAQAPAAAVPAGPAPTGPTLSLCAGAYNIGPPANNPPAGSGPVVYYLILCFEKQANISLIEPQTYLYYIKGQDHVSLPSRNDWKPYNPQVEQVFAQDFKTLWATNFLTDLSIETADYPFSNGVIGKIIIYRMEERERLLGGNGAAGGRHQRVRRPLEGEGHGDRDELGRQHQE
jgi:hypothetical protein